MIGGLLISSCTYYESPICDEAHREDVPKLSEPLELRYFDPFSLKEVNETANYNRIEKGVYQKISNSKDIPEKLYVCRFNGRLIGETSTQVTGSGKTLWSMIVIRESPETLILSSAAADKVILGEYGISFSISRSVDCPQKKEIGRTPVPEQDCMIVKNSGVDHGQFVTMHHSMSAGVTLFKAK